VHGASGKEAAGPDPGRGHGQDHGLIVVLPIASAAVVRGVTLRRRRRSP
jgi:hypothetical protein